MVGGGEGKSPSLVNFRLKFLPFPGDREEEEEEGEGGEREEREERRRRRTKTNARSRPSTPNSILTFEI